VVEIPCVRFDDLSPEGSGSFGLIEPVGEMVARRIEDVVPMIAEAEKAARAGSWVAGFVSYEAAPAFNPVLAVRPPGLYDPMRDLPLARFQAFRRRVELPEIESAYFPSGDYNVSGWSADASPEEYRDDHAAIGRAIMAGEVSRLTHTFRLHAAFNGDPAALYTDLIQSQRGPHGACLDVGRFRVISASPAGFFRRVGDTLTMRPVLASIRRGRWLEEDMHLAELLRQEGEETYVNRLVVKEIEAELAELGQVLPNSESYAVERLETLWHLVTEMSARVRSDVTLAEVFGVIFPPVSVTGVPKAEAMALVTATEGTPRGVYCGAIGFLAPASDGCCDASFSVAVRTVVIDQEEGVAEFGVGAAITTRSEAVAAYEEARLKSKVLVDRRPDFALVEDFRCESDGVGFAEEKLRRLLASARYFGYEADVADIETILAEPVPGQMPCVIRVLVDREGSVRGEVATAPPWQAGPGVSDLLTGALAAAPASTENVYLFHNTTNQRFADSMQRQHPDADVVVYCNERDEVAGALGGNIVVSLDGDWVTPPVECGNVPTGFRKQLVGEGVIIERIIQRAEMRVSSGIGLLDDIHGWRRVELVD
jgi:para-aminobenzoate synthetase/4-amino-4-deoxychorismate lyase